MAERAEIVRQSFERFNADDVEGLLELFDAEMEFHDVPKILRAIGLATKSR